MLVTIYGKKGNERKAQGAGGKCQPNYTTYSLLLLLLLLY